MVKKVAPYFMFDGVAKEAMALYVSIFPDSQILESEEYGTGEQGAEGSIKTATFTVGGRHLAASTAHSSTTLPSRHRSQYWLSARLNLNCMKRTRCSLKVERC